MQDPRSNVASSVPIPAAASESGGAKGKLNRKKRKRRNHGKGGHARTGSKSSLKDIAIVANANANASSSESEVASSNRQRSLDNDEDDVFEMEHDTEAAVAERTATPQQPQQPFQQQQPLQPSVSTPLLQPTSTPLRSRRASGDPLQLQQSGSLAAMEQSSFLQSRLGHSTIESILDSQEKLKKESDELAARKKAHAQQQPPGAMDYFSEPELMSPQGSRPPSPVLSDTGRRTTRQTSHSSTFISMKIFQCFQSTRRERGRTREAKSRLSRAGSGARCPSRRTTRARTTRMGRTRYVLREH